MDSYDKYIEELDFENVIDGLRKGFWKIQCLSCGATCIVTIYDFECICGYCGLNIGHPLDLYSDTLGLDN